MRGLVTAGRVVRLERIACLASSVAGPLGWVLIAASRVTPRAAATVCWSTRQIRECYSSSTARDQRQPASSPAVAMLATSPACAGRA
jgi:hypothetical protein